MAARHWRARRVQASAGSRAASRKARAVRPHLRQGPARPGPLPAHFPAAAARALAQGVVLVALLHAALGVTWSIVPATLAFSMLLAVAFAALHYLFTVAFGRVGIMVSILLLALQLAVVGGLFPVEIVASPF